MNTYPLIKRFSIIVEKVNNKYPPTLRELREHLHRQGFEISERTLQRDIERLRTDFGLDIFYDLSSNTYRINPDNSACFDSLLRIIRLFHTSDVLWRSLKEKEKTLSMVSFEKKVENTAGTQHLEPLFSAICSCNLISFSHENFEKETNLRHTIKPFMLKEYDGRWYVVGAPAGGSSLRIFGLDRISDLAVEAGTFKPEERSAVAHLFDHSIGLVYDAAQPETVTIAVSRGQAKYFRKTPLHHSQQLVADEGEEVIFSYFLTPNRELQRLILGYGVQVKALSPKWFAQQVADELKKALDKYQK
ncbi:MAG: WYL domain-containing protein [Prevotellaceae bacterium]|jgi:predicted DNA-binding transcriptional regulator YafY|nr:WYL domain-containing protein [Prevotellaceae bacterium]